MKGRRNFVGVPDGIDFDATAEIITDRGRRFSGGDLLLKSRDSLHAHTTQARPRNIAGDGPQIGRQCRPAVLGQAHALTVVRDRLQNSPARRAIQITDGHMLSRLMPTVRARRDTDVTPIIERDPVAVIGGESYRGWRPLPQPPRPVRLLRLQAPRPPVSPGTSSVSGCRLRPRAAA